MSKIMKRRSFLLSIPLVLFYPHNIYSANTHDYTQLPVVSTSGGVADCLNSWRQDMKPLIWNDTLAQESLAWCIDMFKNGFRHAKDIRAECIAIGYINWAETINAWIASHDHLNIIRIPELQFVGVAGIQVKSNNQTFWTMRLTR